MMDAIAEESVGFLFNLDVQVEAEEQAPADSVGAQPQLFAKGLQEPKAAQNLSYSAPTEGGEAEVRDQDDVGGDPEVQQRQRQVNVKNKNRQKAKQQRKSRKKNR
jgi:preprotein translocase subunit SecA